VEADARDVKAGALTRRRVVAAYAAARGVRADPIVEPRRATEHVVQAWRQRQWRAA
jgi:hypothetical protein